LKSDIFYFCNSVRSCDVVQSSVNIAVIGFSKIVVREIESPHQSVLMQVFIA